MTPEEARRLIAQHAGDSVYEIPAVCTHCIVPRDKNAGDFPTRQAMLAELADRLLEDGWVSTTECHFCLQDTWLRLHPEFMEKWAPTLDEALARREDEPCSAS
jgi:hypothetical protein